MSSAAVEGSSGVYNIVDSDNGVHYMRLMIETRQTETFTAWFANLCDVTARKRIANRIAMVRIGHFGDVKSVGDKVSELRIDHGPGYRVYFTRRGAEVIILLVGGDKDSQARDIVKAKEIAAALE